MIGGQPALCVTSHQALEYKCRDAELKRTPRAVRDRSAVCCRARSRRATTS